MENASPINIKHSQNRQEYISQVVVTAAQMRDIEGRVFAAGMPVAALMEKVARLIALRIQELFPLSGNMYRVGILVGPGHNGGDALVVARELHFRGYEVWLYSPFSKLKELTAQHLQYAQSLGISCYENVDQLPDYDFLIDGLFGFGLERHLTDLIASAINQFNEWDQPIISIDIPSGLHTETGEVLGTAICATYTLCLGLWKLGLLQDHALEYVGKAELIDFDIPFADVEAILGNTPRFRRLTRKTALATLPLPRPALTHKYKAGHLLLVCGSRRYAGGAILTALGARASGVGMLSVAVPESLKSILVSHLPEALIIGCPETENGAILQLQLPENTDLSSFNAIACGPGLTREATPIVREIIESDRTLILDADGLNILAQMGTIPTLQKRQAVTVLTPHTGEFQRLFPDVSDAKHDKIKAVREAAAQTGAVVLLKGARTAIANSQGAVWIIPESTPALARGGSGDVLTGLLGGLLAQATTKHPVEDIVATASWWHSQAGILAAQERTELGVDAFTLTQYLSRVMEMPI
ncbi:bifunctional ADP-dependent NAD(P)H-hydrate dehydratase/NAD(P)H-hydrate epimerase [Nostoc sp. PCC 7107]|uniref:bifunctional ADP-dependent NAD(P)H-hydrate dehydratase/NAD(P)H-hydrate epimerase n=1 Tax=Nostoc sp. PCC 7107 TaxID=317936 RepID=UPI00029F4A5F|nr:bifunctional ADP-dependent NAD(P)H-hydrate dehydratase/NAD(P)H-hydrate epimerase [Nostoc sp. PCC 7107]AFY44218.1 YjeF-related protein [Nostoc sp. PCC 7107]